MCVPLELDPNTGEPVIEQPGAYNTDTGATSPPATTINSSGGVQTETPTPAGGGGGGTTDEGLDADGRQTEGSGFNQPNIPQPGGYDPVAAAMAAQASMFSQLTKDILAGQQGAAAAIRDGFLSLTDQQTKALAAADEMRKNTGQQSRKPNYSLSLKTNAKNNRSGITSTMLTGVGGVATGQLPLGKQSLLGG